MTRMYIQPSFVDSCSDHGEWSGGNGQYRGDRSAEVVPTYINGKPNVKAFSDEAIDARRPKKSSIPLKQRILPQASRVERLTQQMQELVAEYKQGLHTPEEYSLLLSVISAKRSRAEQLLKKAISVKAPFEQDDTPPTKQAPINIHPKHTDAQEPVVNHPTLNSVKQKISSAMLEAKVFWGMSAVVCVGMILMSH